MVMVKICGLRRIEDARACREAGVDLAGLNFVPGSRRRISPEVAAAIIPALGDVRPVGLFRDAPRSLVAETVEQLRLPWVQLHGTEAVADYESIARNVRILRAFVVPGPDPEELDAWRKIGALPLFDGPAPGEARAFEWAQLQVDGEFFVAGGLNPRNVSEAIGVTGATGVDVASGVERGAAIAADLVLEFARGARQNVEERS